MGLNLAWLGSDQRLFLERGYLKSGETPEQRYQKICDTIENTCGGSRHGHFISRDGSYTTHGIGKRFEYYVERGWVSFSSPILSNFGSPFGLPISCNFGKVPDTLDEIFMGVHEVAMLAKNGAGTAKNFSPIRGIGSPISGGGKSESVIEWIGSYADMIKKVSQGTTRRGFFTAYLSVTHPEIMDFLSIGDEDHPINNITTAVTIPNKEWMDAASMSREDFESIEDPAEKERVFSILKVWARILKARGEKGYPYILFEDNCNKNCPQVYLDKDMWIDSSNICIEAIEYCDKDKEFACCLSSVIATHFDEWKNHPMFLKDMYVMLDCVITEYIRKGSKIRGLEKAVRFAQEHRAIGLGIMGFHSYLQNHMIPFGSVASYSVNNEIFSLLRSEAEFITKEMAHFWGEPEILKGYNQRNTSKLAQAPTKSSAFIHGCHSEGINPWKSNYSFKDLAKIQIPFKNPILEKFLEQKGYNNRDVWTSILEQNGSVQHLEFLSDLEKDVFKVFPEISQVDIVKLAAQRQKYIDMGQSLNLMFHKEATAKDISKVLIDGYRQGIKSFYYQFSISAAQEFNRELMECSACEA